MSIPNPRISAQEIYKPLLHALLLL